MRTVAGRTSAAQVVAANLDVVLVVDALAGEARLRRVERYLAVAWSSGATPVVVLTKADLCDDVAGRGRAGRARTPSASRCWPSARSPARGWTPSARCSARAGPAAMVGPSGVGKSSLANALAGGTLADDRRDPRSDGRGRHTTTARELHLLPGGGLLVDTPGMRELALYDDARRAWTPPTPTSPRWPPTAGSATARTAPSPAARSPPPSTTAGWTPPGYSAWRKLQAEAHRQLLRVDARARAAEKARLRSFHRALRDQPNRLR